MFFLKLISNEKSKKQQVTQVLFIDYF